MESHPSSSISQPNAQYGSTSTTSRPRRSSVFNGPGTEGRTGLGTLGVHDDKSELVGGWSNWQPLEDAVGGGDEDVNEAPAPARNCLMAQNPFTSGHSDDQASSFYPTYKKQQEPSTERPRRSKSYWSAIWPLSPVSAVVLKCSLAYFVASLFTFVPALSSLLSTAAIVDEHGRVIRQPAELGHMVATMVVFFNAGKSLGNMLLSNQYCLGLVTLATIASLLSIATFQVFDRFSPTEGKGWDSVTEVAGWTVCFAWIGGTMGVIAWAKVWIGSLHFNGGCSMAAILLYNVVLREGSIPKLFEILEIICFGVIITNFINLAVFPVSSTTTLQTSISKSLDSFKTLLDLLTSTFLLEKTVVKDARLHLKDAVRDHAATFSQLKNDLAEAKRERIFDGRIRGKKLHLYEAAVASLGRLAQHLSGLRSCERLQESLIKATTGGKIRWEQGVDGRPRLVIVDDNSETAQTSGQDEVAEDSLRVLVEFRELAGARMDALNVSCDQALDAVQGLSRKDSIDTHTLVSVRSNLADALQTFKEAAGEAITKLYVGADGSHGGSVGSEHEEATLHEGEDSGNGPNETVFLIYFFLFTFEEFAREMLFLLDTMAEIVTSRQVSAWDQIKSYTLRGKRGMTEGQFLYAQLTNIVPVGPSKLQAPLHPVSSKDATSRLTERIQPPRTKFEKFMRAWGEWEERMEQPDMRYAIKTGLGGALLALPAYLPATRALFLHYRGEWALVAFLSAMSQTVGQTNYISLARIFGTVTGGLVAVIFSRLFSESPIVLPLAGFLFSMVCYYVITQMPDYFDAGRFTLLTYNLSCLFAYNSRNHSDVTVELIALERTMSVTVGIVWAGLISRYWWPFTARRELRMGLSDFCLDLSYLYSKLVTTYSKGSTDDEVVDDCICDNEGSRSGETTPLLPTSSICRTHLSKSVRQFMSMELHLQSQLGSLRNLLAHTRNEPRLKGPFAYGFYQEVLLSCERVLDRLHSMRCVTTRDEWDNHMRRTFVLPVNKERREMAGNVILYFYTLSAGLRLRSPMPPYLPPAESGRQKLVHAIRSLDVVRKRSVEGGGRHLLFFAYSLAMQEVIAELEHLGTMMQDAFGVIPHGSAEEFEGLFADEEGDDAVEL
ncbi:hypothetical protein B9479_007098 [Cryptococcus floricola]|uniref:Integral membrane bound transporter domain-containing protein n=1 Tax=Cryptococcus floricola TaxID=2591691 RepID=A0A5D3ANC5_9TREE|nr:hypothetical protein B9479_007098 [Cryptococcus floricola]